MSNRDRFYEVIKPVFENSRYAIEKPTSGKYMDKIIMILSKASGAEDFRIWCHIKDDRLDFVVKDYRINQIPSYLGLETKCKEKHSPDRLDGADATSFRKIDEEALIDICKYIVANII